MDRMMGPGIDSTMTSMEVPDITHELKLGKSLDVIKDSNFFFTLRLFRSANL